MPHFGHCLRCTRPTSSHVGAQWLDEDEGLLCKLCFLLVSTGAMEKAADWKARQRQAPTKESLEERLATFWKDVRAAGGPPPSGVVLGGSRRSNLVVGGPPGSAWRSNTRFR